MLLFNIIKMLLPGTRLVYIYKLSRFMKAFFIFPRIQNILLCGKHDVYKSVNPMNEILFAYFHRFFKLKILVGIDLFWSVPW